MTNQTQNLNNKNYFKGLNIHCGKDVEKQLLQLCNSGKPEMVVTLNPEIFVKARENYELWKIIQKASLITADGVGIAIALGGKIKRVTGTDLTRAAIKICADNKWTLGLLGGRKGAAKIAVEKIQKDNPSIKAVDLELPADIYNITEDEKKQIREWLSHNKIKICLVAWDYGQRELVLHQIMGNLSLNTVFIGVGGVMDYLAGIIKRAPVWMRRLGLEWLFRLITQPRLRLKRQIKMFIKYFYYLCKNST